MNLKNFLKVLLAFAVLTVISVAYLIYSVNTDRNKLTIQRAILTSTGYELTIAGDIDVNLFPSIGLTLNDVRLKNPAYPQELASTTAAVLQVDFRSLFGGNILIRELSADDFHINYYTNAEGINIWEVDRETVELTIAEAAIERAITESIEEQALQQSNEDIVTLSVERLQISNASIDIQDVSQGVSYRINNLNLDSIDTNIEGRPFDINLTFNFLSNSMADSIAVGLSSNIIADVNSGTYSLNDINFNLTPMLLQGQVTVTTADDITSFDGSLQSNSFDIVGLLQTLGMVETEEEFTAANSTTEPPRLSLNFEFSGNQDQFSIPNFSASLGRTELQADANIRFATDFSPTNISYNVISNGIDLSPFISETEDGESIAEDSEASTIIAITQPPTREQDTDLPIEALNSLNVIGSISIESLTINDLFFRDINIFTNIEDGVLDIEIQPIEVFEGTVQGAVRLDGRSPDAILTTLLTISKLNVAALAPTISRLNSVTGKLDADVDFTANGATVNELRDSISGSTTFAITENTVDIGVIKQVFTAIVALGPTGEAIQQWPDVIQFSEFSGYILLEDGIDENQQVKLRMDNFDITGNGGVDLAEQTFNYDLLFTVLGQPFTQTIQINELYHDVSWPVECSAGFADPVSQYCRPDFTQAREIFTQIGTNAVRSRLNDVITDQVPEELRDTARSLLRSIFN